MTAFALSVRMIKNRLLTYSGTTERVFFFLGKMSRPTHKETSNNKRKELSHRISIRTKKRCLLPLTTLLARHFIWKEIIPSINNFHIFLHHFCDLEYDGKENLNLLKLGVLGHIQTQPISEVLSKLSEAMIFAVMNAIFTMA